MTGPAVDIQSEVATLKAQGAPDEAIHAYLAQRYGPPTPTDPNAALHREFRSGNLAKRMTAANAADQAAVPSMLDTASEIPETIAAGVPGAKLAIAAGP